MTRPEIVGELQRVLVVGDLIVYHRRWSEPGMKEFVVYHAPNGKFIREFARKEAACRWAVRHRDRAEEMRSLVQQEWRSAES